MRRTFTVSLSNRFMSKMFVTTCVMDAFVKHFHELYGQFVYVSLNRCLSFRCFEDRLVLNFEDGLICPWYFYKAILSFQLISN